MDPLRRRICPKRLVTAALVVAFGASLVGCGNHNGAGTTSVQTSTQATRTPTQTASVVTTGTSTTPTTLPHAILVGRLNSICHKGNAALAPLAAKVSALSAANDYSGLANVMASYVGRAQPFTNQIVALQPSPSDRDTFDRYRLAVVRLQGLRSRLVAALRANANTAIQTLGQLASDANKQKITAAIDLGTSECGHS
jgi:hypothetical protein